MKKSKEYIKNTLILLLGKFTTQFMSFLLLPLYTKLLATDDFGTVDLMQTYISLLVPVLTLRLDSATFRFLIDCRKSKDDTKATISNVLTVLFATVSLAGLTAIILPLFGVSIPHYPYICANLIVLMTSNVILQILRGLGKNIHYAVASIIAGVGTLIANVVQIAWLKQGAESILVSSTIANILCIIFIVFSLKLWKNYSPKLINKKTIKKFLRYSIPMIPNSLSWWVVNVSDRTIIRIFLGAAYNGIYTVSCKFSNVINSVFTIFNISWQETASLHIDDKDRDEFFSSMINKLWMLFSSVALCILVALPIFYNVLIGQQYWESYNYIPVLLYANSWNVLISLIGGIYVAKKRTKEIANTTIISAIINIIINLALVKFIGLHAATISTLVSYMVMAIYRAKDCQKYVKYKPNVMGFLAYTIMFALSTVSYIINNPVLNFITFGCVVLYVIITNKNDAKGLLKMLKVKKHRE